MMKAADRADRENAAITKSSAKVWFHSRRMSQQVAMKGETFAKDQLFLATELKPRRFRTRSAPFVTVRRPGEMACWTRGRSGWGCLRSF